MSTNPSSSIAEAMRLKCRAIPPSRQPLNGSSLLELEPSTLEGFSSGGALGARTGSHIRFIFEANRSIALPFFPKLDVESDAGQTGERRGILIGLLWVGRDASAAIKGRRVAASTASRRCLEASPEAS